MGAAVEIQLSRVAWWDDWPARLSLPVQRLGEVGCDVRITGNGDEMVSLVVHEEFDLMIVDLLGEPTDDPLVLHDNVLAGVEILRRAFEQASCVNRDKDVLFYSRLPIDDEIRASIEGFVAKPHFLDKFASMQSLLRKVLAVLGRQVDADQQRLVAEETVATDLVMCEIEPLDVSTVRIRVPQWDRGRGMDWPIAALAEKLTSDEAVALAGLGVGEVLEREVLVDLGADHVQRWFIEFDVPADRTEPVAGDAKVADLWRFESE